MACTSTAHLYPLHRAAQRRLSGRSDGKNGCVDAAALTKGTAQTIRRTRMRCPPNFGWSAITARVALTPGAVQE